MGSELNSTLEGGS
jgi:hypothetical protein